MTAKSSKKTGKIKKIAKTGKTATKIDKVYDELGKAQEIVIVDVPGTPPTITWPEPLPHSPGSVYQAPEPPEPDWAATIRHTLTTVMEVLTETAQTVAALNDRVRVVEEVRLARAPQPLHTVHKLAAGQYEYRGAHISQDDQGRWVIRHENGAEDEGVLTLRAARQMIDTALLAPEPVPVIDRPGYFDVPEDAELPGMWERADLVGGETDQDWPQGQLRADALDHVEVVPVQNEDLADQFFPPVGMTPQAVAPPPRWNRTFWESGRRTGVDSGP